MTTPEEDAEVLKGYTTERVLLSKSDRNPGSMHVLLADRELERRARIEQHELDRKLIAEQVRWMKFSVLASIVSALAGVILGWYLQRSWPLPQSQNTTPKVQSQTSPSKAVGREEKAESVPSKPPEQINEKAGRKE